MLPQLFIILYDHELLKKTIPFNTCHCLPFSFTKGCRLGKGQNMPVLCPIATLKKKKKKKLVQSLWKVLARVGTKVGDTVLPTWVFSIKPT